MNSKTINSKAKPFASLKILLDKFLSVDIDDENSGLDSYINNTNMQSQEDIENARIAQELKNSLLSIDSRFIRYGKT